MPALLQQSPRWLLTVLAVLSAALPSPAAFACVDCPSSRAGSVANGPAATDCCGLPDLQTAPATDPASANRHRGSQEPTPEKSPCNGNCPLPCCRVLMPASQPLALPAADDAPAEPLLFVRTAPLAPVAETIFHPPRV